MEDPTKFDITRKASRRGFLRTAIAVTGLAVVVVACGGQGTPAPTAVESPTTAAAGAASPTPGAAAATTPTTAAAGAGTPTATVAAGAASPTAAAAGAASPTTAAAASGSEVLLNGAGSSFDNPLFSKAFGEFTKANPTIK